MGDINKFIAELKNLNRMNEKSIEALVSLLPDDAVTLGDVMNDPLVSQQVGLLLRMINDNNKSIHELESIRILLSLNRR